MDQNSRRRFLQALGLGGAAAMLPSIAWRNRAEANPDCPRRIVFFTTQHGAPARHWKMNPAGLPPSADGFVALNGLARSEFSHVLDPLYDVRDKISILDGMAMTSAMLDEAGNNHGVAWAHLLVNNPANYTEAFIQDEGNIHPNPTGLSVDQYIARQTAPAGSIPSVLWGTGGRFGQAHAYSCAGDGTWLPLERNPGNAFNRIMGDLPMIGEPMPPTRRQLIQAEQASVLDLAASEYDRLLPQLGADDRARLDLHRQQIRDLEVRLRARAGGRDVTCDPAFDNSGETIDQFFRLATLSLSCDVTRVLALNVGELDATDFGAPAGSDVHQDWAHGTSDEAHMHMANYYRFHAAQFASLIGYLDSVPEGAGTLLDSTMVVWMTELANGAHDFNDCLTLVAGGGATGANLGRYIRYAQNRPAVCRHYGCNGGMGIGPGHNHLMVSAMHHMEMPDNSFNATSGAALDGSTIDLTGPLPLIRG